MQAARRFSTACLVRAPKAAKGKAPPKKASKQSFGKKVKVKDAGTGISASAFAAKIGSSRPVAKLNPSAPKVDLKQSQVSLYKEEMKGSILETPQSVVLQLYALDVMQRQGGYQYFSQFATILRDSTIKLAEIMAKDTSSQNRRILVDGPAGCGKSVTLLQAISLALQQRWLVIAIPRGESLVDSSFPYIYDQKRKSWRQDQYMAELLGRIAEANKDVLQLQNVSKTYNLDRHTIPEKSSLHKMLQIGAQDPAIAHDIFDTFLAEVNLEGRPAVLFTLDNFTITTVPSRYRDPAFSAVHAFDLEIMKTFISFLDGSRSLTKGVVITNTSSQPSVAAKALDVALNHAEKPLFEDVDPRIGACLEGVEVLNVGQYTPLEAKSVVQHYASAGLIRGHSAADITDSFVKQKTLMGGAIGREVFRSCLKHI